MTNTSQSPDHTAGAVAGEADDVTFGRRHFMGLAGASLVGGAISACSSGRPAGATRKTAAASPAASTATPAAESEFIAGTLPIPPLLAPRMENGTKVFDLTLRQGKKRFVPGPRTETFGFNGKYLGPTLRATEGDRVLIRVENHLGETTTVHWHGMHLPATMDGGPMRPIADRAKWNAQFAIRQPAATLWYHPHGLGATLRQVKMGLAGLFILDDADSAQAGLPQRYGIDDIPIILQAQGFDANNQFVLGGGGGGGGGGRGGGGGGGGDNADSQVTLVNGEISPVIKPAVSRLRLRLLNASKDDVYTLGFRGGESFSQIASDGGLLAAPVEMTRLRLGPAERAEIVIDVTGSRPMVLRSFTPADGDLDDDNQAPTGKLLTINPPSTTAASARPLAATLAAVKPLSPRSATRTRTFVMGGDNGDPTINGLSMRTMADLMNRDDWVKVKVGTVEIWDVRNDSDHLHAFHVHDVQFRILDRDGARPAANERGRKDTVLVRPSERVRLVMRFPDYRDPRAAYMYHCHFLNHEDSGMMGPFAIT